MIKRPDNIISSDYTNWKQFIPSYEQKVKHIRVVDFINKSQYKIVVIVWSLDITYNI